MTGSAEAPTRTGWEQGLLCAFYGGGIIGMLLIYGLLQERIMGQPYGSDMFTISVFLVWINRVVAVIFAISMAAMQKESLAPAAPLWKYVAISFSNVAATTCQYEALRYVAFPVQMLGKSFKMMPVMLWGMAISRKHYTGYDWLIAAMVTGGVTEFLLTGPTNAEHTQGTSMHGLLLLLCFLAFDGFTSTFQEKLFKDHKTSKYNQMMYVSSASAILSFGTLAIQGNVGAAFIFCSKHPTLMRDAAVLSASAVGGQWFIISQVKEFGALVFAATMNARQVISILVSYMTYGHPITRLQIVGLLLVFGGLLHKSYKGMTADRSELKPFAEKFKGSENMDIEKPTAQNVENKNS